MRNKRESYTQKRSRVDEERDAASPPKKRSKNLENFSPEESSLISETHPTSISPMPKNPMSKSYVRGPIAKRNSREAVAENASSMRKKRKKIRYSQTSSRYSVLAVGASCK